jgi:hypothetical protein
VQSHQSHLPVYSERRRSRREPVNLLASWRRGQRTIGMRVLDLSLHGVLLATDEAFKPNYVMDVSVVLPSGAASLLLTSRFVGECRGTRGIGAAILLASPEDEKRWSDFYRNAGQVDRKVPAGMAVLVRDARS